MKSAGARVQSARGKFPRPCFRCPPLIPGSCLRQRHSSRPPSASTSTPRAEFCPRSLATCSSSGHYGISYVLRMRCPRPGRLRHVQHLKKSFKKLNAFPCCPDTHSKNLTNEIGSSNVSCLREKRVKPFIHPYYILMYLSKYNPPDLGLRVTHKSVLAI